MATACPVCGTSFGRHAQCPNCAAGRFRVHNSAGGLALQRARWQETASGRVLIGLLLSQGLFHGFRQLFTGLLLAFNRDGGLNQTVTNPVGFVSLQVLEMVAVLLGGILAGSGQRRGPLLGGIVGLCNGVLCAFLQFGPHGMWGMALYGQPVVHVVFGALGGWVGYAIWRPAGNLLEAHRLRAVKTGAWWQPSVWLAGRISWLRAVLGVCVAVVGCTFANLLRDMILDATTGRLATTDFQDNVITWELKALLILTGSFLGGVGTRNGFKQGLFVGLVSAVILIGVEARGVGRHPQTAGLMVLAVLFLGVAGGCAGSQLFPPLLKYRRRTPYGASGPL